MTVPRSAVYAVPPAGHPLWSDAADWLGRDPATGGERTGRRPDWLDDGHWRRITAEPRLYGFHGTLKPPFALAAGQGVGALEAALARFAAEAPPLAPIRLVPVALSGFLALVPAEPAPGLAALADRAVEAFEPFRAPPGAAELDRRRAAGLTTVQEAHLQRWGYPYVFDQFRYHMTLTGRLAPADRDRLRDWLADRLAPAIAAPVPLELALFEQPDAGQPFRLVRRYPLGAG